MPSPRSVIRNSSPDFGEQGLIAVVLGAGVAGLLSAHAACAHFDTVFLVDGDDVAGQGPKTGEESLQSILQVSKGRRGIPQLIHPHTLAMGGLQAMEKMLPGFKDELVRRGGVPLDLARDFHFYDFGDVYAHADDSSLKSVGASRALIQQTLQDEVVRRNGGKLRLMGSSRVSGLVWNDDKSVVNGVELANGSQLAADLVVVAAGRSSSLPQWLKSAGHAVPPAIKADAQLTYVGRMYRMPEDWEEKRWLGCICFGRPNSLWGAGVLPVEGRIWQMIQWGYNGLVPPMEEEAFLAAAAKLPDKQVYEAISRGEPLTPLVKYGGAYNTQRSWDAMPPPPGVIAIGDAVQALNPVYAQGMSVAAKSAEALSAAFAASIPAEGSAEVKRAAAQRMGPAFQKRLAGIIAPAWMMATSEDLRYPGTKREGVSPPPKLVAAYIDSLCKASHRDAKVMAMFFEVAHLVRAPAYLFHPRMVLASMQELVRALLAAVWPARKTPSAAVKAE